MFKGWDSLNDPSNANLNYRSTKGWFMSGSHVTQILLVLGLPAYCKEGLPLDSPLCIGLYWYLTLSPPPTPWRCKNEIKKFQDWQMIWRLKVTSILTSSLGYHFSFNSGLISYFLKYFLRMFSSRIFNFKWEWTALNNLAHYCLEKRVLSFSFSF